MNLRAPRQSSAIAAQRSRVYSRVLAAGIRGVKTWDLYASVQSTSARISLDGLVADGWVEAHPTYRGDGTVFDVVYVATRRGRGQAP